MAYTALFAFGDSLSDAGNDWIADGHTDPVSPYYQGHFSNGLTWVEDLSNMLGLGTLTPSLAGGHDFAFGGAETARRSLLGRLCQSNGRSSALGAARADPSGD